MTDTFNAGLRSVYALYKIAMNIHDRVMVQIQLGWSGSGSVIQDHSDHETWKETTNPPLSKGFISSLSFMIRLFQITDPDPENFQGMHYDFLKKANSKALIDCLTLSQLHTLKGLLIDQQLHSSTDLEKCLMHSVECIKHFSHW